MNEPEWLDKETVLRIHEGVVDVSGGSQGVRDEGLLESALSRAQNAFAYEQAGIFELAAVYAEGIAHNHPFIDGNKRTALMTADVFLALNGYELASNRQPLADIMVDLAEKKVTRDDLAEFFRVNCHKPRPRK